MATPKQSSTTMVGTNRATQPRLFGLGSSSDIVTPDDYGTRTKRKDETVLKTSVCFLCNAIRSGLFFSLFRHLLLPWLLES